MREKSPTSAWSLKLNFKVNLSLNSLRPFRRWKWCSLLTSVPLCPLCVNACLCLPRCVCVCLKTNSPFVRWVTRGTCICVSHCITWCNMETATTVVTLWLTLGPLNPSSFYRSTSVSLVFFFPVSLSPDLSLASPSSSLSFSLLLCLSYNSWWFTSLLFFQFFQLCPLYDCETGLSTGYGWFSWWRGIHSMSKLTVFFSLALLCTLLYFAPSAGQRNKRATERERERNRRHKDTNERRELCTNCSKQVY